jgi:hypothetical protein
MFFYSWRHGGYCSVLDISCSRVQRGTEVRPAPEVSYSVCLVLVQDGRALTSDSPRLALTRRTLRTKGVPIITAAEWLEAALIPVQLCSKVVLHAPKAASINNSKRQKKKTERSYRSEDMKRAVSTREQLCCELANRAQRKHREGSGNDDGRDEVSDGYCQGDREADKEKDDGVERRPFTSE